MGKYIILLLLLSTSAFAGVEEEDAIQHVSSAVYGQLKLDEKLNELILQHVSKEYIQLATRFGPFIRTMTTQRLDIKWTF